MLLILIPNRSTLWHGSFLQTLHTSKALAVSGNYAESHTGRSGTHLEGGSGRVQEAKGQGRGKHPSHPGGGGQSTQSLLSLPPWGQVGRKARHAFSHPGGQTQV